MCIAILNTKGTILKKELLHNCWKNNGDGAGMLYINDEGDMGVFKEMKSFDSFYNKYAEVKRMYGKRNIVLHFRISTHGGITESNCHPFMVHKDLGFVHNGMIYNVPDSKVHSDTYMFNEVILKKLKEGFEYDDDMLDLIEMYIGAGSKLIFLNANDDWAIANEKAGHWDLNCWFSNSSYKQVNDWVDYGGTKKYKANVYGYGSYGTYNPKTYWAETPAANTPAKASKSYSLTDDNDSKMYDQCSDCGMLLYAANEFIAGKCDYCTSEVLEYDTRMEGSCECCNVWANLRYEVNYDTFICGTCEKSLTDEIEGYDTELGA